MCIFFNFYIFQFLFGAKCLLWSRFIIGVEMEIAIETFGTNTGTGSFCFFILKPAVFVFLL